MATKATADGFAQRLRGALAHTSNVTERRMFGGVCFLLRGNMFCAASKRGFMFRVGPDSEGKALNRQGATPMMMNGRRFRGFVRVDPAQCTERQLSGWVGLAQAYVASLPPKK